MNNGAFYGTLPGTLEWIASVGKICGMHFTSIGIFGAEGFWIGRIPLLPFFLYELSFEGVI